MQPMNDSVWSRPILLLLVLALGPWLGSCQESEDYSPAPPPEHLVWIEVDVYPDWVDAPWTLTRVGATYTGAGDSTLALDTCGQYKLYGGTAEDLVRYPISSPQIGVVDFGDTLSFGLQYDQVPWGRLYPGSGSGFWSGLCAQENGAAMVCGTQDDHPRVAVLDRNGHLMMDETEAGQGAYFKIIPEADSGFLIGGHTDGAILLSKRDLTGAELWNQSLSLSGNISFGDLVVDPNTGYLLLVNVLDDTPLLYPTLIRLDGLGQQLSRLDFDGPLARAGLALAPRSTGGFYYLQLRQTEGKTSEYTTELLLLDENLAVEQTRSFDTGKSLFSGSLLSCADGGVAVTIDSRGPVDGQTITHVIRLSATGQNLWQVSLEIIGHQYLNVCEEFGDGHFLLAGSSYTEGGSDYYTWLVELDSAGQVLRDRQFNMGPAQTFTYNARVAWDGGLFMAGKHDPVAKDGPTAWVNRAGREWFVDPMPE